MLLMPLLAVASELDAGKWVDKLLECGLVLKSE